MTLPASRLTPFRLLIACFLIVGTSGSALALQDDLKDIDDGDDDEFPGLIEEGEYVSPQFDVEITWTDAWAVGDPNNPDVDHAIGGNYDGPVASDPVLGDIVFLTDTESETSVLSLGFSPATGPMDTEVLLDAMDQESFLTDNLFLSEDAEVLLIEGDDEHVAILARDAAPNDEHVVYMLIQADPGREDFTFWAGLDLFESDEYERILNSIDDDIDVDGYDPFAVFGADEILEAIETGAAPVETEVPETEVPETEVPETETPETEIPETEVPETEEPVTEPVETEAPETEVPATEPVETEAPETEVPATEQIIDPPDGTPTPGASPVASPVASPASDLPGLVGTGEYVSPQYGVPITWTEAWTLSPAHEPAIASHTDTGVDEVYLADAESGQALLYLTIEPSHGMSDAEALLQAMSEPAYIESVLGLSADTEVALTRTQTNRVAVMYVDASTDDPVVVILEAHIINGDTHLFIELRTTASNLDADLLEMAEDTVEAGGEDAMDILDADDVIAALP
jgi:hypothetical protein